MFPALTYPSAGGKFVFTQHLVSSLSVNVCTVHWLRAEKSFKCLLQRHVSTLQVIIRPTHVIQDMKHKYKMPSFWKFISLLCLTLHVVAWWWR